MRKVLAIILACIVLVSSASGAPAQSSREDDEQATPLLSDILQESFPPILRAITWSDLWSDYKYEVPLAVLPGNMWIVVVNVGLKNVTMDPIRLNYESFVLKLDDGRTMSAHHGWTDYFNGCAKDFPCDPWLYNPGMGNVVTVAVVLPAKSFHATLASADGSLSWDLGQYPAS